MLDRGESELGGNLGLVVGVAAGVVVVCFVVLVATSCAEASSCTHADGRRVTKKQTLWSAGNDLVVSHYTVRNYPYVVLFGAVFRVGLRDFCFQLKDQFRF